MLGSPPVSLDADPEGYAGGLGWAVKLSRGRSPRAMSPSDPAILILEQDGIGTRIAEARKLRGLTQAGLAMLVPCSGSLVSQVERGAKPATPWFVAAVARALHIDVPQLLGQPYRGTTERTDRVHASIPQIRIALTYWDVPPDLAVAPRPLEAIGADIAKISHYLDTVDYAQLGKHLPGADRGTVSDLPRGGWRAAQASR